MWAPVPSTPRPFPLQTLKNLLTFAGRLHPVKAVALGYAGYMLAGWVLLCLPISEQDATDDLPAAEVSALDHLFTAASAVSTTGLATVSTPTSYSLFGEIVVLGMIQLGGLGYMTAGSFVILVGRRALSDRRREVSESAFSLPEGVKVERFLARVVLFTLLVEAAGALALYFCFVDAGVTDPLWPAIFHSVSAFCTAGFSLFTDSLEGFRGHFWTNAVVSALSLCGALGFLVLGDVWGVLTGGQKRLTLTSRIILASSAAVLGVGWLLLFVGDASLAELPADERVLTSFFQSMTAMTTVGFNTHPIGTLALPSVVLMLVLMVIGASPSGTGGGMKSTTVTAMFAVARASLTGRREITSLGRVIPEHRLRTAAATVAAYLTVLTVALYLLSLTEDLGGPDAKFPFEDLLFETASALGTVGLSRGITGDLSTLGKLLFVGVMFLGRLGPLSFGVALLTRAHATDATVDGVAGDSEDGALQADRPIPVEDLAV